MEIRTQIFDKEKRLYNVYFNRRAAGKFEATPHIHSHYEIIFCEEGRFNVFSTDNYTVELKAGDVIVIFPNSIHGTYAPDGNDYDFARCAVFQFSPTFIMPSVLTDNDINYFFTRMKFPEYLLINSDFPYYERIVELLKSTYEEVGEGKNVFETIVRGNFSIIYAYLLRFLFFDNHTDAKYNSITETTSIEKNLYKSIAYIEQNYMNKISMSDVAKECNISYSKFSSLFSSTFGQTFSDYLCEYRINKSKEFLLRDNRSITEIAYDSGFENLSYFSKKFKHYIGMSANDFRKLYISDNHGKL